MKKSGNHGLSIYKRQKKIQTKIIGATGEKELRDEAIELLKGKVAVLKLPETDLQAVLEAFESEIGSEERTRRDRLSKTKVWE